MLQLLTGASSVICCVCLMCAQLVARDRSTAMMEKPLQQRIDHLQHAWGGAASGTSAADGSSLDETFLLSIEAAQASAGAAVEAEIPRATVGRSRSTNTTRAASPARSVAGRSSSRSAHRSASVRATSPKPARRSPARASPAQRHQSPQRQKSARVAEASASASSENRPRSPLGTGSLPLASTATTASSTVPIQRVVTLEGEVVALKNEVAAMREDMNGLRCVNLAFKQLPTCVLTLSCWRIIFALIVPRVTCRGDVASMAQEIGRAIELMSRKV